MIKQSFRSFAYQNKELSVKNRPLDNLLLIHVEEKGVNII